MMEQARGYQEATKGIAAPTIRSVVRPWQPLLQDDAVRVRIRTVLACSTEQFFGGAGGSDRPWSWWMLRHVLGGAVDTVRFRRFIDEMIAEGLLVEVIQRAGVRLTPRHLLILTEQWGEYALHPGTLLTVRGRTDVLRRFGLAVEDGSHQP